MTAGHEAVQWRCLTTVRKFEADIEEYRRRHGQGEGERLFALERRPFEERVIEGNLLLQEGIQALFTLLTGGSETAFNNANARIGVGDGTAAAVDTQTDLQGSNKAYKAMDTSYPIVGALAAKKVTFRASFGSTEGNFAWQEWVVDNGASAAKTLNRKVESLGTKTTGTWMVTVDISLA